MSSSSSSSGSSSCCSSEMDEASSLAECLYMTNLNSGGASDDDDDDSLTCTGTRTRTRAGDDAAASAASASTAPTVVAGGGGGGCKRERPAKKKVLFKKSKKKKKTSSSLAATHTTSTIIAPNASSNQTIASETTTTKKTTKKKANKKKRKMRPKARTTAGGKISSATTRKCLIKTIGLHPSCLMSLTQAERAAVMANTCVGGLLQCNLMKTANASAPSSSKAAAAAAAAASTTTSTASASLSTSTLAHREHIAAAIGSKRKRLGGGGHINRHTLLLVEPPPPSVKNLKFKKFKAKELATHSKDANVFDDDHDEDNDDDDDGDDDDDDDYEDDDDDDDDEYEHDGSFYSDVERLEAEDGEEGGDDERRTVSQLRQLSRASRSLSCCCYCESLLGCARANVKCCGVGGGGCGKPEPSCEADDEQSDWPGHEATPGPRSVTKAIIPWWDDDDMTNADEHTAKAQRHFTSNYERVNAQATDDAAQFRSMIDGALGLISESGKSAFYSKMNNSLGGVRSEFPCQTNIYGRFSFFLLMSFGEQIERPNRRVSERNASTALRATMVPPTSGRAERSNSNRSSIFRHHSSSTSRLTKRTWECACSRRWAGHRALHSARATETTGCSHPFR